MQGLSSTCCRTGFLRWTLRVCECHVRLALTAEEPQAVRSPPPPQVLVPPCVFLCRFTPWPPAGLALLAAHTWPRADHLPPIAPPLPWGCCLHWCYIARHSLGAQWLRNLQFRDKPDQRSWHSWWSLLGPAAAVPTRALPLELAGSCLLQREG